MNVGVVGAGLAGLAAACELADRGHRVTVLERRPWAGGKTYSFASAETGEQVDNGQHVFMNCTTEYVGFLRRLGTLHLARRQRRLRVKVLDARGRQSSLYASNLPSPLHLAASFAMYRHLALRQKVQVARAMLAARRMPPSARDELDGVSFETWLSDHGQAPDVIEQFWDFLVLPTLNCRSGEASAASALFVLQEGFLKSDTAAGIGVPTCGLTRLHVDPAVQYVESRGGTVLLGQRVNSLVTRDGRAEGLTLDDGRDLPFDAVVLALPHREVARVLPAELAETPFFAAIDAIPTAPIINVHLWFDRPVAGFDFAAFVGTDLQWVFNPQAEDKTHGRHLVVSLSGAQRYMAMDKGELADLLVPQLQRALPAAKGAGLLKVVAIKEPDATFVPAPGIRRPGTETPVANLFLAGAYTATGWPATMESAVRSGLAAARAIQARAQAPAPQSISVA